MEELESLKRDAARYRWLRDRAIHYEDGDKPTPFCVVGTSTGDCVPESCHSLDGAVDAAIKASEESKL